MLTLWLTLAVAATGCPPTAAELGAPADPRLEGPALIAVLKDRRRLGLYREGALQGCWRVGLAAGYVPGPKLRQGDLRTPEGWYRTSDKPWSSFYGAIAVHYPEVRDADRALREGRIDRATRDAIAAALAEGRKPPQTTALGGEILIHGGGGRTDWTLGCVALDDADLDALRAALPPSMETDVLILP